jgi:hypothetical protein
MGVSFWYRKRRPVSTALIALAPTDHKASAERSSNRPRADFLTHVIATVQQAPQTRARRRVEPDVAIAAYCATGRSPVRVSHALTRSL